MLTMISPPFSSPNLNYSSTILPSAINPSTPTHPHLQLRQFVFLVPVHHRHGGHTLQLLLVTLATKDERITNAVATATSNTKRTPEVWQATGTA